MLCKVGQNQDRLLEAEKGEEWKNHYAPQIQQIHPDLGKVVMRPIVAVHNIQTQSTKITNNLTLERIEDYRLQRKSWFYSFIAKEFKQLHSTH